MNQAEVREVSYSSLKRDDEETQILREKLQIYNSNKETDLDKVWKLKGTRSQIEFVYNQLKAHKFVFGLIKKEATTSGLNLVNLV